MFDADEEDRRRRLAELEQEHRDLDSVIERVQRDGGFVDQLQLRRFKKRKLQIKDAIARLKSLLIPDQPA